MHNPTLLESNFLRREKSVSESDNFLLLKKVRIEHKSVVLSTLGFRFTQFSIYTVLCQNIIISFKLCSSCFLCCKCQKMTSYYTLSECISEPFAFKSTAWLLLLMRVFSFCLSWLHHLSLSAKTFLYVNTRCTP